MSRPLDADPAREGPRDWHDWHAAYDRESTLHRRLEVVRRRIGEALDASPPGEIRVISMCAGQGRDLLPVAAAHRRRDDVVARLVELDARNAEIAAGTARASGLTRIDVVRDDAGRTASYDGAVPADLVLACGVFGNVTDADIAWTVDRLPSLCAPHATVVWTRGRTAPDLTPAIRGWFAERGFVERSFDGEPGSFGVGVHVLAVEPEPFDPDVTLFTFIDFEELVAMRRRGDPHW